MKSLVKKPQTFLQVLQEQRNFADRVLCVQGLMEGYQKCLEQVENNIKNGLTPIKPMLFEVYFSERVRKYYKLEDGDIGEHIWEALDTLVDEIENGTYNTPKKYIGYKGVGGVYSQIDFVPKKNKITVLELMRWAHESEYSS